MNRIALGVTLSLTLGSWALAQTVYTQGQSVEVREGDSWSAARIMAKEGRKYRVRIDGGTDEEWVGADRLRTPVAANQAKASPDPARTVPAGGQTELPKWTVGQLLESKRGSTWRTGRIARIENGWIMVLYDTAGYREWVEPWRVRARGSTEDRLGKAPMHADVSPDQPAPKDVPPQPQPPATPIADPPLAAASNGANSLWTVGQNVQAKWCGAWWDATIERKEGDWLFVLYSSDGTREWVEPWRIRQKGSSYDCGFAKPNPLGEKPPKPNPDPPPGERTRTNGERTNGDVS